MSDLNLSEILFYIDKNIHKKITLLELADFAGYSPFYFSKVFAEKMGLPVTGYIRIRKLQYAMVSLLEGEKVVDVAFLYGFESHEGFTRSFKQLFGTAPGKVGRFMKTYQVPDYTALFKETVESEYLQEENMMQKDLNQLVFTVLRESLEEMKMGFCTCITIHFMEDGAVTIADNGRGIPLLGNQSVDRQVLDKILAGKPITALEYSQMGDFQQMSLQTVNSLCENLHVDIYRDGKQFFQDYIRGIAQHEIKNHESDVKSGMMMILKPDTEIYGNLTFAVEEIEHWLKDKTHEINVEVYCEEAYIKVASPLA